MKYNYKLYRCPHCGNIVSFLNSSGVDIICCGEEMQQLKPNTVDASQEKHVPVAVREGNLLKVTVGAVPHPMTEEHHIAWIAVLDGAKTQIVALDPLGAPEAQFVTESESVTVYEYCNLHGLWAADF